jgi:hypothetical protein
MATIRTGNGIDQPRNKEGMIREEELIDSSLASHREDNVWDDCRRLCTSPRGHMFRLKTTAFFPHKIQDNPLAPTPQAQSTIHQLNHYETSQSNRDRCFHGIVSSVKSKRKDHQVNSSSTVAPRARRERGEEHLEIPQIARSMD